MGTWISHLRIAENLLQNIAGLDETAFAFGNLAPDSGFPNEDWTQFEPPKEVTHFLYANEDEGRIKDLEFYRRYLAPNLDASLPEYSFLLGYFFHLLCDNLWAKRVVSASKRAYDRLIAEEGLMAWQYMKRDWYNLDQCYVREHQDCLFWRVIMRQPNPPAYLPFLQEGSLHHQLNYIRDFYSKPDPQRNLDRSYPYLNEVTMNRFVYDSTEAILKIYPEMNRLVDTEIDTALSLLAVEEVCEYELPIGG
ncbi:MAG: zinc dependent phospholipase C family protein [Anaerolineae bacterium]|nr:zinc dependent phospholipase C family protein [Anaerolineae bacterium]